VDSSMRCFGCSVGFGFGVVWMTVGLGSAIVCALLAALGYGAVFVAERSRANAIEKETSGDELALSLDGFDLDQDASTPLAAEVEYGWPIG
jgi:hypothetical protein